MRNSQNIPKVMLNFNEMLQLILLILADPLKVTLIKTRSISCILDILFKSFIFISIKYKMSHLYLILCIIMFGHFITPFYLKIEHARLLDN